MTDVLADADMVVKAWANSLDLGAATGRVFFGIPEKTKFPAISMNRYAGLPDEYLAVDMPRFQFDSWGLSIEAAAGPANKLRDAIRNLTSKTETTAGFLDGGKVLLGPRRQSDANAHISRYIIDAEFFIRA